MQARNKLIQPLLVLLAVSACGRSGNSATDPKPKSPRGTQLTDRDLGRFLLKATSRDNVIEPRQASFATAVGNRVLIWGGSGSGGEANYGSGAFYNLTTNAWEPMAKAPLADFGSTHPIWTGNELIVWDSYARSAEHRGAVYNPTSNSWRLISSQDAPGSRDGSQPVWTSEGLVVIGGNISGTREFSREIYRYSLEKNHWTRLADAPASVIPEDFEGGWGVGDSNALFYWSLPNPYRNNPTPLVPHMFSPTTLAWTPLANGGPQLSYWATKIKVAGKLTVWGGITGFNPETKTEIQGSTEGGVYDPTQNSWTKIETPPGFGPRFGQHSAARGTQVLIFGGCANGSPMIAACKKAQNDGILIDTTSGKTKLISSVGAPEPQYYGRVLPFGEGYLVFGGLLEDRKESALPQAEDAFYYDPTQDTWSKLGLPRGLTNRINTTVVVADPDRIFIWGGLNDEGVTNSGGVIQFKR